ncbi:glutathione S-transferase [Alteromonas sp. C1M14]|uniref:glutathione S-transferase family protein n=1 Tax=Alteromonas sp. C1M14 TaxID=2841567 RepID=UPI001C091733|nr:glutathione S-transferase [Alteromonas sp. C1M14]MBU2978229.1 glutathione S-transferase [Alteromonas sp. C1M14]
MKLYDMELSGNCYKVRLFCALIDTPIEIVEVDFMNDEHKSDKCKQLNPFCELPILVDNEITLRDSQAILVYLASKYGDERWWPKEPYLQADVMQWLSVAASEIRHGPNAARLIDKFNIPLDRYVARQQSARILSLLEEHLSTNDWLAAKRLTIADCAVFPYVALSWEGGIEIQKYPHIQAWLKRIKQLPNFISMPGI